LLRGLACRRLQSALQLVLDWPCWQPVTTISKQACVGLHGSLITCFYCARRKQTIKETWWWNEEVAEAVRNKKIKYGKWKKENTEKATMEYKKSRHAYCMILTNLNFSAYSL